MSDPVLKIPIPVILVTSIPRYIVEKMERVRGGRGVAKVRGEGGESHSKGHYGTLHRGRCLGRLVCALGRMQQTFQPGQNNAAGHIFFLRSFLVV